MFDYETLRVIAWLAIGTLLIIFIIMDGYDIAFGSLLPYLEKIARKKNAQKNIIAPRWDECQIWLVSSVAMIFVIWPSVYYVAFPVLYWAILFLLVTLLSRPFSYKFRSKIVTPRWCNFWDWTIFITGSTPAILIGIAYGNLLLGIPFRLNSAMYANYEGIFFDHFHPFALLCGTLCLSLIMLQGASILALKTKDQFQNYAINISRLASIILLICFSLAGFWICYLKGIIIDSMPGYNGIMSTVMKTAYLETGAWLNNFRYFPILWLVPILVYVMVILTLYLHFIKNMTWAFFTSSLSIVTTILSAIIILFPFVLPCSIDPAMSITLWDGSMSYLNLAVVLIVALIFIPGIIIHTITSYHVNHCK